MPNLHEEGFEPVESTAHHSEQPSTPRRRRVGRRVTRGAGAAGEVKVTVQEHGPLFTEPQTPALPASQEHAALPSGTSTATTTNTPDSTHTAQSEDRSHRRRRRPMTSLLFQEPVIPERHLDDLEDDDDTHTRNARPQRKLSCTNDDTAHSNTEHTNTAHDDQDDTEDQPRRRRRRTRRKADDNETPTTNNNNSSANHTSDDTNEQNEPKRKRVRRQIPTDYDADFDDAQSAEETPRRKSNRRLNAQERRAAAEVEQIEEDLVLDDITYAPIDDAIAHNNRRNKHRANDEVDIDIEEIRETNDQHHADSDDEEEGQMRTRRRRRSRRADRETQEETVETQETVDVVEDDDEEEETTVTRRRRRRRNKSSEEEAPVQRSRKQQYIDEITDVEGSTRLEAKKQRRRDNRRERSRQNQLLEQDFLARRENVDRLMVVRQRDRHTQISVLEDNVLVEHYVSDIQEVATVGNIYLGRVQNVLPSMEAAFVDIGQARNGVLYAGEVNWDTTRLEGQPRRIELAFKSGDPVLVQVTKDPIGHKGARLTSQVTLAGRFLVLVPSGGMTGVSRKLSTRERSRLKSIVSKIAPKDMGVIIRTAAEGASEEAITKDLEGLIHQWDHIQKKFEEFRYGKRPKLLQGEPDMVIRVVRDIFNDDFRKMIVEGDDVYQRIEEYIDTMAPDLRDKLEKWDPAEHQGKDVFDKWSIDSQLRKAMERQVYLPSGGSIVIDRTEAMTTIDVNTGRFIGKGKSLEETVTRCNLEASEEIARQLRLRDIGGMIMIDYVDMVMPSNRDLVLRRLVECLARDRTKHQVAEVTSLGLVQMTRKRIGQGLVEAFSEECPTCSGRGFIVHDTPTVSADYDDPYALKGGDPFVKTNKHGHGSSDFGASLGSGSGSSGSGSSGSGSGSGNRKNGNNGMPKGSSAALKAKLAQIAAAAVAANNAEGAAEAAQKKADTIEVQIEHIEELVKSEQLLAAKAALDAQNEEAVAQSMADIVAAAVKDAEATENAGSSDSSVAQTVDVAKTEATTGNGDVEESVTVESGDSSNEPVTVEAIEHTDQADGAVEESVTVEPVEGSDAGTIEVSETAESAGSAEGAEASETVTDTNADESNFGEATVEAEVTDSDSSSTPEDDVTVEVVPDSSES